MGNRVKRLVIMMVGLLPLGAQADERFREHERRDMFEHSEFPRHHHGFERQEFGVWYGNGLRYYYPPLAYPYPMMQTYPPVVTYPAPSGFSPPPPQPQTWFYCDNPGGYYPYVQVCAQPFRAVQAR